MQVITLKAQKHEISGSISLPLSKSISNRILMMHALSDGLVRHGPLSEANDTVLLKELLKQVSAGGNSHFNAGNGGTVLRFLTAFLSITPGSWTLDGDARMRQRPVGPLVDALNELGADISYESVAAYPPLRINGRVPGNKYVNINAGISSQFVSALMMIGPALPAGLHIGLEGNVASYPYIRMTAALMQQAGARLELSMPGIRIEAENYKPCLLETEHDWSSAAFWYALMALAGEGSLFLPGLKKDDIQGDRAAMHYFRPLGVETHFEDGGARICKNRELRSVMEADMRKHPDLAPALIAATAAKGLAGNFCGLETLRIKESDRVAAIMEELEKCGIKSKYNEGCLSFGRQKMEVRQAVDPHGDHRIAMAFAPLAMLGKPLSILQPEVVSKSYPGFWEELKRVTGDT